MSGSRTLLLPRESSHETRRALQAAMLGDWRVLRADVSALPSFCAQNGLHFSTTLAIGSVEYLRAAFESLGAEEPSPMSYPPELRSFLLREIRPLSASDALALSDPIFLKSQSTKILTGFVFDPSDPEHRSRLLALNPSEPLWASAPVRFIREDRFYIHQRRCLGSARYDPDGEESIPAPDASVIERALLSLPSDHPPLALDFGALHDGQTALVEANDAWALGLYSNALDASAWLDFLWARWERLSPARSAPRFKR